MFDGLTPEKGFYTSKDFLPVVSAGSKPGMCGCDSSKVKLPELHGKVIVLGAGDTAFDCATSAFRCGAARVVVCLRRALPEIRAVPEEADLFKEEQGEFLPYMVTKKVIVKDDRITGIEFYKTEKDENGKYYNDEDQFLRLKCDFVISAFGSTTTDSLRKATGMEFTSWGTALHEPETGIAISKDKKKIPGIFAGGDVLGHGTTVEASNDGKTASWAIHRYLQSLHGISVPEESQLPNFYTEIDKVDISVEVCGLKFLNPYGLASATPATSADMIRRSFEEGWAFAVTKTYGLDRALVTNVSPRIVRGTTHGHRFGPNQSSFLNIELISEKSAEYWFKAIGELKEDFPDRHVIASIMAPRIKEDWEILTKESVKAGAVALELNLSCPHGTGETGMGLACGQHPEIVEEIVSWVRGFAGPKMPLFVKITPNVTDTSEIAAAAKRGGADGVTAINTISALMGVNPKGIAWPNVGTEARSTYGGMSGNATRPVALRCISSIARRADCKDLVILGAGGAESADTALQMILCGASLVQVCSAVQNQDFTIVQDFISGLQCLLYMKAREDLSDWNGQTPPSPINLQELVDKQGNGNAKLGPYITKRIAEKQAKVEASNILAKPETPSPAKLGKVPTVLDVSGDALPRLGSWYELDVKAHTVAIVDEDKCINCGKCYMTCNDSGYQSITFDAKTHLPTVTEDCTGCTLCVSVCPIPDCITMVPRDMKKNPYVPIRGILPKDGDIRNRAALTAEELKALG
eukprot:TRINITY_DN3126_c0_g2_i1.p1 TRINITY_DN3126_c0_g2~~TRINITY_DN3126_c0_g2_i1.p1  ORF type:complete len:752 (+),score=128.88 TRINITY_DN3126_c0_g2_i1:1-2256(+)